MKKPIGFYSLENVPDEELDAFAKAVADEVMAALDDAGESGGSDDVPLLAPGPEVPPAGPSAWAEALRLNDHMPPRKEGEDFMAGDWDLENTVFEAGR